MQNQYNRRKRTPFTEQAMQPALALREHLLEIYNLMSDKLGDLHWWPAETTEEIVIGAILVQNVAWTNVVKALCGLREHGLLSLSAIHQASACELEPLIRSTLYYRMKTKKLKAFAAHVQGHYDGELTAMLSQPLNSLREELLSIYGIGEETADDIVLYAAEFPSFVVDTYTKRIFDRLGYVRREIAYATLRDWFMKHLPPDVGLYNQYHALIDAVGHRYCAEKRPSCDECPLRQLCSYPHGNHP